jgi:hypothetical protein
VPKPALKRGPCGRRLQPESLDLPCGRFLISGVLKTGNCKGGGIMSNGVRLVYEEVERLRCVFNAIVIKNSALNEKYPGGLRAYLEKHGGRCNRMTRIYPGKVGNRVGK